MERETIKKYGVVNVNPYKVYVPVQVIFDARGNMHPTAILWEDGSVYPIERVNKVVQRAAQKAGGQGDRYEVVIGGQTSYLFYEHNPDPTSPLPGKWFAERKRAGQT